LGTRDAINLAGGHIPTWRAAGRLSNKVFMFETIGDFDVGKDPLSGAQLATVVLVIATLMDRFNLGDAALKFHNEMSDKSCPGSSVQKSAILALVGEARESTALGDSTQLPAARQKELLSAAGADAAADQLEKTDEGDLPEHDPAYERAIEYWFRK
jgi:hypothetical protein